jgi:uroporphyrinogen decarboxylase
MALRHLPVQNPRPDGRGFIELVLGRRSGPPPLVEYLVDEAVLRPVVAGLLGRPWPDFGSGRKAQEAWLDNYLAFWHGLGYDVVRFEAGLPFVEPKAAAADPTSRTGRRDWADEHGGAVRTWEDFERYPWPRIEEADFFPFEYLARRLPEGMGLVVCHAGGVFEHLSWIMSYEGLCLALADDPALVEAVADKVGRLIVRFSEHLLGLPGLVALFPGDDMGFKTGPLVSPADLRRYVLPWHRRLAAMAHDRGLAYILHSCGNLASVMDDLIDDVRVDGKHSFEDAILPAEEFQEKYGRRVAVLGGVDVNVLSAGSEAEVRHRTRRLIERCGPRGRFAVGSGNSIPSYVPARNYLAMVDEALDVSR